MKTTHLFVSEETSSRTGDEPTPYFVEYVVDSPDPDDFQLAFRDFRTLAEVRDFLRTNPSQYVRVWERIELAVEPRGWGLDRWTWKDALIQDA